MSKPSPIPKEQYQLALAWRKNGARQSLQGFNLSGQDLTLVDLAGQSASGRPDSGRAGRGKSQAR